MRMYELKDPKEICKNGRVTAVDLHNIYFLCVSRLASAAPKK